MAKKIVHLVRHAESSHNKEGQVEAGLAVGWLLRGGWHHLNFRLVVRFFRSLWRLILCKLWPLLATIFGKRCFGSEAPSPYEHMDASLTSKGWIEIADKRKAIGELRDRIELVVVSPLTRTLQTAAGLFGGRGCLSNNEHKLMVDGVGRCPGPAISIAKSPPFLAVELCREQYGVHPSSKRNLISKYREQFPGVDFSQVESNEDMLWRSDVQESEEALQARCKAFVEWLLNRPEKEIAVVSHGGFLSCLLSQLTNVDRHARWPNCELKMVEL